MTNTNFIVKELPENLALTVDVNEDGTKIFVTFTGLESKEDAEIYASYLADVLPVMLFETGVKH
jgi:hypothetical protein